MAATRTSGARKAMIRATASSEAVSVSIRKVRGTRVRIAEPSRDLTCGSHPKKCRVTRLSRRTHVHAANFNCCAVDDDYQRHLLGFVGQYLQGCQKLPIRTFLLGLRGRHFPDLPRL